MITIILFQDAFSGKEVWVNPLESVGILIVILIVIGIVRAILKWADTPKPNKVINEKGEYTGVFNEIWEKEKTDKLDNFNAGNFVLDMSDADFDRFKQSVNDDSNNIDRIMNS